MSLALVIRSEKPTGGPFEQPLQLDVRGLKVMTGARYIT